MEVYIKENVLSKEDLEYLKKRADEIKDQSTPENSASTTRIKYDTRSDERASKIFMKAFINKDVYNETKKFYDYAWRSFNDRLCTEFECAITRYGKNGYYAWHIDHTGPNRRTLNIIIYLNTPDGGEIEISTDYLKPTKKTIPLDRKIPNPEMVIKPKENMMVIFPAQYPHVVKSVNSGYRIIIHGHTLICKSELDLSNG